jgi:hypothetical protein
MSKRSGGLTTYNIREGFRSEYLAHFAFSAFGPSNPIQREDDFGLDLICNLSEQEGKMLIIKSTYGVQVKSKGAEFKYKGKQATEWLSSLEFPVLFAEVSKEEFLIKIYSCWNINRYLLGLNLSDKESYPEEITFTTEENEVSELPFPDLEKGIIPLGHPIINCKISDLTNQEIRTKFWEILKEWLEFDNENYKNRRAGASLSFGYTSWKTNEPLSRSLRVWNKQYYYSPQKTVEQKKLLYECSILLALYYKNNGILDAYKSLKEFIEINLNENLDDFGKELFK